MIKKLVIINLLILLLPFFQTCSDNNISHNTLLKNSPLRETVSKNNHQNSKGEKEYNYTLVELTVKKQKTIKDFINAKKELTFNGYQAGFIFIQDLENLQWGFLPYTISIILVILLIIFSFRKQYKIVFILSIANFVILVIPLLLFYFADYLEDFNQLKIGYYFLFYNLVLIVFESYSQLKRETSGNRL